MHELSLIADLMRKVLSIAHEQNALKVTRVKVQLGALSHISSSHFREHFANASKTTIAEMAELDIEILTDMDSPDAQSISLKSIDVETSYGYADS
ncbi:hydrogenase maturation nickel metallochaperone HypA [bacterium]|nr:hydrogenase maturation nickel metallochaperone HypA [bacterium]MCI0614507.1 hydrogenase maturation nickel metallochaperone HypA [bacterium]